MVLNATFKRLEAKQFKKSFGPKQDTWFCQNRLLLLMTNGVMVFNATFNNISIIWWWSVLLVVPGENHRPVASH